MNNRKKTTLLIMAAGLGSRYGGNKQVDCLGPDGEILMQYSVYDAIAAGFNKIVFIIKPEYRELLEDICRNMLKSDIEICFAYQDFSSLPTHYRLPDARIKPFGTVHAVLCAKDVINEPFAIINADDFYGRDAFSAMHSALVSLKSPNALMVAYRLQNTLSANGTVTRGVCVTENGKLKKIRETYSIGFGEDGRLYGDGCAISPSTPVSMNMWGFTPKIFPVLESSFDEFLDSIEEGDIKAEYVLPSFVDKQISAKAISVDVLHTDSEWFGVTYKEDRDGVARRLQKLKDEGIYPKGLII